MTSEERILIVGGSSGMGLGLAGAVVADGAEVTIVGRSPQRLRAAREKLGDPPLLHAVAADATIEADVRRVFDTVGPVDHVVTTAVDITGGYGPIGALELDTAQRVITSKLIAPWLIAKYASGSVGASITFTSGIAAYRPMPGAALVAAANAALPGLCRALAVELAPIRVNVISPGWVDTPVWDSMAGIDVRSTHEQMARRLPARRIGRPTDLALAFLAVMRNEFITGEVLNVDGGHRLV